MIKKAKIVDIKTEILREWTNEEWVSNMAFEGMGIVKHRDVRSKIICQTNTPLNGKTIFETEWMDYDPAPYIKLLGIDSLDIKCSPLSKKISINSDVKTIYATKHANLRKEENKKRKIERDKSETSFKKMNNLIQKSFDKFYEQLHDNYSLIYSNDELYLLHNDKKVKIFKNKTYSEEIYWIIGDLQLEYSRNKWLWGKRRYDFLDYNNTKIAFDTFEEISFIVMRHFFLDRYIKMAKDILMQFPLTENLLINMSAEVFSDDNIGS